MASNSKLYDELYKAFTNANTTNKSAKFVQDETNTFWNDTKTKVNYVDLVKQKILELSRVKRKTDASLMTFWAKVTIHVFLYFLLLPSNVI